MCSYLLMSSYMQGTVLSAETDTMQSEAWTTGRHGDLEQALSPVVWFRTPARPTY